MKLFVTNFTHKSMTDCTTEINSKYTIENSKYIVYDDRLGKRFKGCSWCGWYSNIDYMLLFMNKCAFEHSCCPSCFEEYKGSCPTCWMNHPKRVTHRNQRKRYYQNLSKIDIINSGGEFLQSLKEDYLNRISKSAREQFRNDVVRFQFLNDMFW